MMTRTSWPSVSPVTVVVGDVVGAPFTSTTPPGSVVVAVISSVPAVADVVVAAYRRIAASNSGYIPTAVAGDGQLSGSAAHSTAA